MKVIAVILSVIIYIVGVIMLSAGYWVTPKDPSTFLIVAYLINSIFAGLLIGEKVEQFYKWFKSNLK